VSNKNLIWILLGGAGIYYIWQNQNNLNSVGDAVTNTAEDISADVQSVILGWKNSGSGPTWVPVLNQYEQQYNLPIDILAAVAYQESAFIESVIRGLRPSSDGLSLGIMQLQTQFYPDLVGPTVPVPYTDQNVSDQINRAAQEFNTNYSALGSWPATIAAWNQGLSGVERNGITSTSYVAKIVANAPAASV
jgi:hypothetical protein